MNNEAAITTATYTWLPNRRGIVLPDGLDYNDWLDIGYTFMRAREAATWALADWLAYGEKVYGETYAQALDDTHFSYNWLVRLRRLALEWPHNERRYNVGITLYETVTHDAIDRDERHALLEAVVETGMSRDELRIARQSLIRDASGKTEARQRLSFTGTLSETTVAGYTLPDAWRGKQVKITIQEMT